MAQNIERVVQVAKKAYQNEWLRKEVTRLAKDPQVQKFLKNLGNTAANNVQSALNSRRGNGDGKAKK